MIAASLLVTSVTGTTYTWVATTSPTNYWTNTANWSPSGYPNAVDDIADFTVDIQTNIKIFVDVPITVGTILMGDTTPPFCDTYIYTNAGGYFNFSVSAGKALVANLCTNPPCQSQIVVNGVLQSDLVISNPTPTASFWITGDLSESGTRSLVVQSHASANVNLYGDNTFTGGVTIQGGLVSFYTIPGTAGNPVKSPLGKGTAPTTILSGGLRPHASTSAVTNPNALVIAGHVNFPYVTGATNLVMTGPVLLSNGTWTLTCDLASNLSRGGVTFAGTIRDDGSNRGLIFAGSGKTVLANTNRYGGDTTLKSGTLRIGATNALPWGSGKGNFLFDPGPGTNALLDVNGFDLAMNGLSNGGSGTSIIDTQSNTGRLTLGYDDRFCYFSGRITNSTGALLDLYKVGTNGFLFTNAVVHKIGALNINGGGSSYVQIAGSGVFTTSGPTISDSSSNNTLIIGGSNQVTFFWATTGLGGGGSANIIQTGGDVAVTGILKLGVLSGTSRYTMSGGTLTFTPVTSNYPFGGQTDEQNGSMYVGLGGSGGFTQTGGTVTLNALILDNRGDTPAITDTYSLLGGTLNITTPYGILGNPSSSFVLGNGVLNGPTTWTNGVPLILGFSGTNTLTGTHTNASPVVLSNGTLCLLGHLASGSGLLVTNGATLTGLGSVSGPLTVATGSSLSPGSNGVSLGSLTVVNLNLGTGATFSVNLNGLGPVHDAVVSTGPVSLGGSLTLSNLVNPLQGAVFTIIRGASISGEFAGLPDGTFFSRFGRIFQIQYSSTNVRLIDEGTNSSGPQVSLVHADPWAVTNGSFAIAGFSSNLSLPTEIPRIHLSTNGGPVTFLTQAFQFQTWFDAAMFPEGTNVFAILASSSNGTTNQTWWTNVIDRTAPSSPAVSVPSTNFDLPFSVSVSATDLFGVSALLYTMDGSTPGVSSSSISNGDQVAISNSCTFSIRAMDRAGNMGPTVSMVYARLDQSQGLGLITRIHPNPLKSGTDPVRIEFRRSTLAPVDLILVDMSGRVIAEMDGAKAAGNYLLTFSWDGKRRDGLAASRGLYQVIPRIGGALAPTLAKRLYVQ